jgi:hypothetical protein
MNRLATPALAAAWIGAAAAAAAATTQKDPSPPTVEKCTPDAAVGWAYYESVQRQGDSATLQIGLSKRITAIMNALPRSDRPVSELMNANQSAEFATVTNQLQLHRYNDLAESRLQRDMSAIGYAVEAIEKMRAGALSLKSKYDTEGEGAGLVGLLRKALEKDADYGLSVPSVSVCSVDLALFRKEQEPKEIVNKLIKSPEMQEWMKLCDKYGIKAGQTLDPQKLPSPDKEKAIWLTKAVVEPFQRALAAANDFENLRLYARASELEYSTFRDDILASAGAKDYDYDTGIKKAYSAANSATKHAIEAWGVINKSVPTDLERMMKQFPPPSAASAPTK